MAKIYKLEHKKRKAIVDILIILGIIVSIVLFSFIMFLIKELTGFNYVYYIEFILLIVFAVFFAKRRLIEFTYYLEKRRIRIDRIYSARPKLDLLVEFKNVVYMGVKGDMPIEYKSYKRQMETFKRMSEKSFCIVHFVGKRYYTAVLSPSLVYQDAILSGWNDYINSK
jgi:hypothetical protein